MLLCTVLFAVLAQRTASLSYCTPVDSIFIINSELIVQDRADDKIESFFSTLIYEATSELSGIGLLAFDVVPDSFRNPILGLTETLGVNTANSMNVFKSNLNFKKLRFYDDDSMNGEHRIELNDAIMSAHDLFVSQSAGREFEALFIMNVESDAIHFSEICQTAVHSSYDTEEAVESIYYLQLNHEFEIQHIVNCVDETEVDEFDALTDLYDITCPTEYDLPSGTIKFSKNAQGIELGSIVSCDMIPIYSECKQSYELSPESSIVVHDDLNDDMSYEIGYVLIASKTVFPYLPKDCTVPVLKIVNITEVSVETEADNDGDDKWERVLRINVIIPDLFDYLLGADVEESDDDVPYFKEDEDIIDQDEIQKARDIAIEKRRRRLWGWSSWNPIDTVVDIVDDVVDAAVDLLPEDILDQGVDLILSCLPDFDLSLPSFSIGCSSSGCEFTLDVISMDEEFSQSKSASNKKMSVSGTGTVDVDVSVTLYFKLGIHSYGPNFEATASIPPVYVSDLGAKLYGTFRLTASARAVGSGQIEYSWTNIISKYLTNKPIVKWVGYVPIVLWPKLTIGLEGSLDSILEITAEYSYVYEATFELGARVRSSGVTLIKKFTDKSTTLDGTEFDAVDAFVAAPSCPTTMAFKVGVPINLGVEFYLAIYPHIQFTPYIEGEIIIPYSGCYNDGGCTSSGYPTGILVDSALKLAIDVGIRASALGYSVACIFDLPQSQEFGLFEATIYDIPAKKICSSSGLISLPLWKSCCSSSGSSLSCTSWPSYSGTYRQRCEAGNDKNDGYLYLYNQDRGTSQAICGQSASCWCCRMNAPSAATTASLSCTSWPSYSGTYRQRCEAGNDKNDGYLYLYNQDRGTSQAICGLSANCWCCRMKAPSAAANAGLFLPEGRTPGAHTPGHAPDFSIFAAVSALYHKNDVRFVEGVFGVLIMLNTICFVVYCHRKRVRDVIKYKSVAMTDSEQYDPESEVTLND